MKRTKKLKSKSHFLRSKSILLIVVVTFLISFVYILGQPQNNTQYAQTTTTAVSIVDFQFSPATITVPVGGTVTWTNQSQGGNHHTTTSDFQGNASSWDSGLLNPGATFSKTFSTPGTYTYHCNVHTFMRGKVIVTANTVTSTPTLTPSPTFVCFGSCPNPSTTVTPTMSMTTPTTIPTSTPTMSPVTTQSPQPSPSVVMSPGETMAMPSNTPVATSGGKMNKNNVSKLIAIIIAFILKLIALLLKFFFNIDINIQ